MFNGPRTKGGAMLFIKVSQHAGWGPIHAYLVDAFKGGHVGHSTAVTLASPNMNNLTWVDECSYKINN